MKSSNGQDLKLFFEAYSHASFANGSAVIGNYNRLEFLGDRIVSLVVAEFLFDTFPNHPVGTLASHIDMLICGKNMARIAKQLKLHEIAFKDSSLDLNDAKNEKVLADLYESHIAFLYRQSFEKAKTEVIKTLLSVEQIKKARKLFDRRSPKAILRRMLEMNKITLSYECRLLSQTGEPTKFTVGVFLKKLLLAEGEAADEKTAAETAEKQAILKLSQYKRAQWKSLREELEIVVDKKDKKKG